MQLTENGYKHVSVEELAAVSRRCTRVIDNPEAKVSANYQAKVIALRDAVNAELDARAQRK